MNCDDKQMLLSAYLDGELQADAEAKLHRHIDECGICRDRLRQLQLLRDNVGKLLQQAPPPLRTAVEQLMVDAGPKRRTGLPPWVAVAAMIATAIVTWFVRPMPASEQPAEVTQQEVVDAHIRSLMTSHLTDVASTDQHTVKPWFAGKLNFSPQVTDLAAAGFPLIGGRLDYLGGQLVAALVFQHRKHLINVFVWPQAGGDAAGRTASRVGYHVVQWQKGAMSYAAVSDLNQKELQAFAELQQGRD